MEITLSYISLALAAATLLVALYLAVRLKAVLYLLQQPVVKKMSPQLRLKPVKLDEAMDRNRNRDRQPGFGGRDGARPERDGRRDGERGREGRPERSEGSRDGRRDGERREGRPSDRPSDRPEGPRERSEGDRPRDGRRDGERSREGREGDRNRDGRRDGRPERRDGDRRDDRRPPREFSEMRDAAPAAQPEYSAPAAEAPAGLPPRRPLPSFPDAPADRAEGSAPQAPAREHSASETFVGSGDDMQHGRRTQLKKKPRFDFDEDETPAT